MHQICTEYTVTGVSKSKMKSKTAATNSRVKKSNGQMTTASSNAKNEMSNEQWTVSRHSDIRHLNNSNQFGELVHWCIALPIGLVFELVQYWLTFVGFVSILFFFWGIVVSVLILIFKFCMVNANSMYYVLNKCVFILDSFNEFTFMQ